MEPLKIETKITPTFSGYLFEWPVLALMIEVDRIVESRREGTTHGEVVITFQGNFPYTDRLNFTSTQGKKTLREELKRRFPADWWGDVIECLCRETLKRYRQGEPIEEITTEDFAEPPRFLLEPVLLEGHPTIIFGLGGTMKSYLCLTLGSIVTLPMLNNPLGLIPKADPTPVLYLDYETDRSEITWRLKSLQRGLDTGYMAIKYRRCYLPLMEDCEVIHKTVLKNNIGLLIIDSIAGACGGDLLSVDLTTKLFAAIRKIRTTSLLVAHTAKNPTGKDATPYGDVFFGNWARSVWELKKDEARDDQSIDVGLFHRKVNAIKKQKPIGLRFKFGEGQVTTSRTELAETGLAEHLPQTTVIFQSLLANGLMTLEEIAEETGIAKNSVHVALNRLKSYGQVYRFANKRWGVLENNG